MKTGEVYSQSDGLWVISYIVTVPPFGIKPIGVTLENYLKENYPDTMDQERINLEAKSLGKPPVPIRLEQEKTCPQ